MPRGIPNVTPEERERRRAASAERERAKAEAIAAIADGTEQAPPPSPGVENRARIGDLTPEETLMAQAFALGMTINPEWELWELTEKVRQAQEAAKQAEEVEFAKAPKVWVYLLRGAYPVEDQKHLAGETIEVTPEIAEKWYEAGVARPGRAPV